MAWLTSHMLLSWKCSQFDQRMPGLSCQIPLCWLHYTLSVSPSRLMFPVLSFIFTLSPSLFSTTLPLFFLMDPSDPSLLKMFVLFFFFLPSKMWPASDRRDGRGRPGNAPMSPRVSEADQNEWDLARPRKVTSLNATSQQRSDKGHTSIEHGLMSREGLETFSWGVSSQCSLFILALDQSCTRAWIVNEK